MRIDCAPLAYRRIWLKLLVAHAVAARQRVERLGRPLHVFDRVPHFVAEAAALLGALHDVHTHVERRQIVSKECEAKRIGAVASDALRILCRRVFDGES